MNVGPTGTSSPPPTRRRVAAALFLLVWAPGCATAPLEASPWREARAAHVVVITDLEASVARELASQLDWFHHFVEFMLRQEIPASTEPARVVVFADRGDFERFNGAGERMAGFFLEGLIGRAMHVDGSFQPALVYEVACHEYVHLSARATPGRRLPLWYEEGLAIFLSQLRLEGDELVVGASSRFGVMPFRATQSLRLRELLTQGLGSPVYRGAFSRGDHDGRSFHASGWALTQYLVTEKNRQQALTWYLELWNQGIANEDAFRSAFGLGIEDAEHKLHAALAKGLPEWRLPVAGLRFPPPVPVQERALARREVALMLGILAADTDGTPLPAAEPLLRAALEAEPHHARAAAWLSSVLARRGAAQEARSWLETAVAAAPEDAQVHAIGGEIALEAALHDDEPDAQPERLAEARMRFARSATLDPEFPLAQRGLGLAHLFGNEMPEAIQALERARLRRPYDPLIAWGLAVATERQGDRGRADVLRSDARYFGLEDAAIASLEARLPSAR